MRTIVTAAAVAAMASGAAFAASESGYLNRFGGEWSGSGVVQPNMNEGRHNVSCSAVGKASATSASIDGSCSAYLVFTRDVGASLTLDPETGQYTGTYVGSPIGPAQLAGSRQGNSLVLEMTWPKDVNGDRSSQMTITNTSETGFVIKIQDRLGKDGPVETTTALNFERK